MEQNQLEQPLFSRRISATIIRTKWWTRTHIDGWRATWPMSRLDIYQDRFEISVLNLAHFTILFSEIDSVKKIWGAIQIQHHCSDVPQYVYLGGTWTGGKFYNDIKRICTSHGIELPFE